MHKTIIITIICLAVVIACSKVNSFKNSYEFDDNIDPNIKSEIQKLNDKVILYLKTEKPKELYNMFTEKVKSQQHYNDFIKSYNIIKEFPKEHKIKKYKEFYSNNDDKSKTLHYLSDLKKGSDTYRVQSESKKIYLSIYESDSKTNDNSYLLTLQYAALNNEWKLETLHIGQNKIHGSNFSQLIEEGKKFEKEGKYFPAIFRYIGAEKVSKAVPFIIYKTDDERYLLLIKSQDEYNKKYKFPFELSEIPTKPLIILISPEFARGGAFPLIHYKSNIPLNENFKNDLNSEATKVSSILIKKCPGLASEYKIILFCIYNDVPGKGKKITQFKTKVEL